MRALPSSRSAARTALALALSAAALPAWVLPASAAGPYEFVPAPQIDLNRVYRVDRATGEVTSCQYGLRDDNVGVTLCFPAGEGAGAQAPAEYGLVASRHTREAGVFRVNHRTGEMSICYVQVREERVVCTPQTNPEPAATGAIGAPARAAPGVTPPQGTKP